MEHAEEEGWYTDPYGLHEARWMSMGNPTKLVRDHGVETYDEVPDVPPSHAAVQIEAPPGSVTAEDTLRADDEDRALPSMGQIDDEEREVGATGWHDV